MKDLHKDRVANKMVFSKLKTNRILNELIDAGYVVFFNGKRGKYAITEKGHKALQLMQRNNC